jgi:filamentous hemagglutinin family protein
MSTQIQSQLIQSQPVQSRQVQLRQGAKLRSLFVFLVLFGYFGTHFGTARVSAQTPGITSANDGTNTQIRSLGNVIHIEGGTTAGNNLFQSFGQFGVSAGQVANFQSTSNIQNILGRVTGGNASIINGQLQVTGSNANLFLINPAGMIFGSNAQLNLPAAFTATTANGIRFGDRQWFNAIGSNSYSSLLGNPTGYGFTAGPGGTIFNSGNLSVGAANLTLLGGTVVSTGTLASNGGTITVQAIPGGKLVRITDSNALLSLDLPLETQSLINPSSTPQSLPQLLTGGNLPVVQGITVQNGVVYLSATQTPISTTAGATTIAGNITANGPNNGGRIQINGEKTFVAANLSATGDTGNGGIIDTSGKSLTIAPSTRVNTLSKTGLTGKWLLDPTNVEVIAPGGTSSADSVVQSDTLQTNLASSDISLQADNSITISTAINSNSGNRLTLDAPTIALNAPIRVGAGKLSGTGTTINVGSNGRIYNAIDVAAANAIVTLAPKLYTLDPELSQGEVLLQKPITIQGTAQGQNRTTIATSNNAESINPYRIFNVTANTPVILRDLTLQNGVSASVGGAILSDGQLTLDRVTLQNNQAKNDGGALYNATGRTATITNSTFKNNTAADDGGAIANHGTMTILNSTLSGNVSEGASSPVSGGGAILNTTEATLTIRNSTISGNTAKVGGGIRNDGRLTLDSNTIVNNSATRSGGGIVNSVNPTELVALISSPGTIAQLIADPAIAALVLSNPDLVIALASFQAQPNSANATKLVTLLASKPDVVNQLITNPTIVNLIATSQASLTIQGKTTLGNTIVAQNIAPIAPDATGNAGSFTDAGHNLIGVSQGFNSPIAATTQSGTTATPLNPNLAPLGNYGGLTETHALHLGSAALNTGLTTLTTDQRGKARSGLADIGAFESSATQISALSGSGQTTIVNTVFNQKLQAKVTDQFGNPVANTAVSFTVPGSGPSATASTLTVNTNEAGIAILPINANGLDGTFVVIGKVNDVAATAQFTLTNQPIANPGPIDLIPNNPIPNNPRTNNPGSSIIQGQELQRSSPQKSTIIQPNPTQNPILCIIDDRTEKSSQSDCLNNESKP